MSLSVIHAGSRPDFLEPLPLFFAPPPALPSPDELPPTLPYTEYERIVYAQEVEDAEPCTDDIAYNEPFYNTECFCENCGYQLEGEDNIFCLPCRVYA